MNEYANIIIPILGTITAFLVWLQRRTEVRLKDKDAQLEHIENKQRLIQNDQIRLQSEAASAAADRLNTQKLIEVIGATNERWQKVMDGISERKHQDEIRLIAVLDKLDTTIDRNSRSVDELADGVSGQLGTVAREIMTFSKDNQATEHYIRSTIETTNRNVDSVLEAVAAIRDRVLPLIDGVERKLETITAQNDVCTEIKQVLEDMKAEFKAILLPSPQPVTQPLPELPLAGTEPQANTEDTENKKSA